MEAVIVKRIVSHSSRVTFGLGQNVLRSERESLSFDNAQQNTVNTERVIGGADFSFKFFDCALVILVQTTRRVGRSNPPPRADELGVDPRSASSSLGLCVHFYIADGKQAIGKSKYRNRRRNSKDNRFSAAWEALMVQRLLDGKLDTFVETFWIFHCVFFGSAFLAGAEVYFST